MEKYIWGNEGPKKGTLKSNKRLAFSIDKLAEDFRQVGYPSECIEQTKVRWAKYDGMSVRLNIDSNNGHIEGTEIFVNIKWCKEAADES